MRNRSNRAVGLGLRGAQPNLRVLNRTRYGKRRKPELR